MGHTKTTGKKAASNASKVLLNPKSTKVEKSAAGSALSQVPQHSKTGYQPRPSDLSSFRAIRSGLKTSATSGNEP